MVSPSFMKIKTNVCHNKCYTDCHGDDISDQKGGRFYPETRVKTPAKISPLTLTLLVGKVQKKTISGRRKEEKSAGGEKKCAQRARRTRGSNLGPAAC